MSALQKISSQMTLIPQKDLREVAGGERVLHHPGDASRRASRSCSWTTRRSRSASPPWPRSPARWAGRSSSSVGPRGRSLRPEQAQGSGRRPAVRDLDRADHAPVRPRPEAGRRPRASASSRSRPSRFIRAENELQELLDAVAKEAASKVERKTDDLGFEWLVVRDQDFEDLVTTVHVVASELEARGFGPAAARGPVPVRRELQGEARLLDLRLQAGRVLAVRPDRRGPGAGQRRGARAEGEDREGAPDRAGPDRWFGLFDARLSSRSASVPHGRGESACFGPRLDCRENPDAQHACGGVEADWLTHRATVQRR